MLALVGLWTLSACALEQRMAVDVIDAPLREKGEEVRSSEAPRGELRLGPYEVSSIVQRNTREGEALLSDVQPRPSTFFHLDFDLTQAQAGAVDGGSAESPSPSAASKPWHASCVAERRVAQNVDFAAAADEGHDEVALVCTLVDPKASRWSLRAEGDVGRGLSGEVRRAEPGTLAFSVEVLARRRFFGAVGRELPFPVVQLREERTATAAMLLDTPERAWFGPELGPERRSLALAVMVALRLLPLGETAFLR